MCKNKDLFSRLKQGILGEGFSQAVTIFIRLSEIPLLLHYWNSSIYGEWLILLSIPAYVPLSYYGLTVSAAREMTMLISNNERKEANSIYQSISLIAVFILIFVIGAFIAFITFIPVAKFIGIEQTDANIATIVLIIFTIKSLFTALIDIYGLRLYCEGMYGINTTIHAGSRLFGFLLLITVVTLGGGLLEASEAMLLEGLISTLFMSIYSRKKVPWLTFGFKLFSVEKVKMLFKPSLASLAFQIGNTSNLQGQLLIVGTILGPESATVFSIHRTLTRIPVQLFSSINLVFLPELSRSYVDNNQTLFTTLFRKLCQISIWGALLICLSMTVAGEPLFTIWTKGKSEFNADIFYLLLASAFINSIWSVAISSATATNRHSNLAIYYLAIYGILSVVGTIIASNMYGIDGAPLSLLLAEIAMLGLTLPFSIHVARDSWQGWLFTVIKPPFNEVKKLTANIRGL
ncbi:MAG: oligosaccharide flippase family protein [Methylobacter sp.]|nr:oligosaccharide flippase family protein [Methylobacter sp.]